MIRTAKIESCVDFQWFWQDLQFRIDLLWRLYMCGLA